MSLPLRVEQEIVARVKENTPPSITKRKRKDFTDHYRFIVHLIQERRLTDNRFKDEGKFVCISHKHLHKYISKDNTSRFLRELQDWEILECDKAYWNREDPKALGYRLRETYWHDEIVDIEYSDAMLREKVVKKWAALENQDPIIDLPGYRECRRWHSKLAIDRASAEGYIRQQYQERKGEYRFRMEAVRRIASGRFWFNTGPKSRRAFHNLSNLPKDLRRFLSVHGYPLRQADIGCSQPLFLHLMLKPAGVIPIAEEADLAQLLVTNKFYEAIMPDGTVRDRVKQRFYKEVLFGKGSRMTKVIKLFNARFPTYAREIARLHEEEQAGKSLSLAALLQSTEAAVVFNAVHRFSTQTNDQVPIMTIHDSLVTTPDHLDLAKEILESVFEEVYQIKPVISIK